MILRRFLNNDRKAVSAPLGLGGGGQRIPTDPPAPVSLPSAIEALAATPVAPPTTTSAATPTLRDRIAARINTRVRPGDGTSATQIAQPSHPDPRLIYARTREGDQAAASVNRRLSLGARRLLLLIDGRRPLAEIPPVVAPGELPMLIKELELQGMITAASMAGVDHEGLLVHPDTRLANLKRELLGAFEAELGPQASVLEARVQDCVNLTVMRNVLRDVLGIVARRGGSAAAERIAARIKSQGQP